MCSSEAFRSQVRALEHAVDALLDMDLGSVADAELADALPRIAARTRNLTGYTARINYQYENRQVTGAHPPTATELPFPADDTATPPRRRPANPPQRDGAGLDRALLPETTAASWPEEQP